MRFIIEHKALSPGSSPNMVKHPLPAPDLNFSICTEAAVPPKGPFFVLKFCGSCSLTFAQLGRLGCGFDLPKLDPVLAPAPSHPLTWILGLHFCWSNIFLVFIFKRSASAVTVSHLEN